MHSVPKKTVGVDIDGTLADFHNVFLEFYNKKHGSNYTLDDICGYRPETWNIPISTQEFLDVHNEIWNDYWKEIKPTVSQEEFKSLVNLYDVEIITQRPIEQSEYVMKWLKKNFNDIHIKVKCVPTVDKKLAYGYSIIFDDANPLAEEILKDEQGDSTILYLITQPWNARQDYERRSDRIVRVSNLKEGIERLLSGR
ncbi:MAG: hypothetical protein QW100_04420 [Thermoplasmatales archaeon]